MQEMKLPRRVLAKWFEKEEGTDGTSSFEKLLEFLKLERKQTERLIRLKEQAEKEIPFKEIRKQKPVNVAIRGENSAEKVKTRHNNCLIHTNSSHLTRKCRSFLQKTVKERGQIVQTTNGCKLCLSISHADNPCPFESEWGTCNINGCTEYHSRLVHGCAIQGISMFMHNCNKIETPVDELSNTLLLIEKIRSTSGEILSFWDSGSTLALVAKSYIKRSTCIL